MSPPSPNSAGATTPRAYYSATRSRRSEGRSAQAGNLTDVADRGHAQDAGIARDGLDRFRHRAERGEAALQRVGRRVAVIVVAVEQPAEQQRREAALFRVDDDVDRRVVG